MSADNGIYIAEFPNGTYRVAHAFESVVGELETHWYTPEEYREAVVSIFNGLVFHNEGDAWEEASRLFNEDGYTEYGINHIQMSVNYGELREEIPVPALPEGACEHCSTTSTTVLHGQNDDTCKNPELPRNILIAALRQECKGINEYVVTRTVLETLEKNGLEIRKVN